MSRWRYKKPWFHAVETIVRLYPDFTGIGPRAESYRDAISSALSEMEVKEYGNLRRSAIDLIYFKKTHTVDGAALQLNVSRRTIQRWTSEFIYAVGHDVGF